MKGSAVGLCPCGLWPCVVPAGQSAWLHVLQIQDAQAAMRLYVMAKRDWESTTRERRPPATAQNRRSEDP